MSQSTEEFEVGQSLTCIYNGTAYDAKVQDIKTGGAEPVYVIHFKGWNNRYDEQIPFSKSTGRLFHGSAKDYASANGEVIEAAVPKKATKKQTDQVRADDSMRGDSPSTSAKPPKVRRTLPVTVAPKELTVELPKALKKLLIDDMTLISRHFNTRVPALYTVDRIISDYIKSIPVSTENLRNMDDLYIEYDNTEAKVTNVALICTARGLADYFNVVLGYQLLYKFERNQYNDLVQKEAAGKNLKRGSIATLPEHGFRASEFYGIIHLLRMLARLPTLLKLTKWNDHLINRVMLGVHDFLVFLNKNHDKYHNGEEEYHSATSEYYRRAQTLEEEAGPSQ